MCLVLWPRSVDDGEQDTVYRVWFRALLTGWELCVTQA
jgi:hypothetical protein